MCVKRNEQEGSCDTNKKLLLVAKRQPIDDCLLRSPASCVFRLAAEASETWKQDFSSYTQTVKWTEYLCRCRGAMVLPLLVADRTTWIWFSQARSVTTDRSWTKENREEGYERMGDL